MDTPLHALIAGKYLSERLMRVHAVNVDGLWVDVATFPKLHVDFVDVLSIVNNRR